MKYLGQTELRKATGAFIRLRWDWAWFATLTYPNDCVTARRVEADLRRWLTVLARLGKTHVVAAFGIEEQIRGAAHAHALVSFEQSGKIPSTAAGAIAWIHGEALVEPYESGKGAPWYLAKKGRWGIMSGCDRTRNRCRRHAGCPVSRMEVPIV